MHKWLKHLIYVFFMMLICITSKSAYATTFGSANKPMFFNSNQSLYIPLPKPDVSYDNKVLTFKGIVIRRYQPTSPNSKNDSDYIVPVIIEDKDGWFIPVNQATGDNFVLSVNNPNLRSLLFSTYWDGETKILGNKSHNLLIDNRQFKFTVNYVFQLPNGLEVGDSIVLDGKLITNDLGMLNVIYTRFVPVIAKIDFPQGVATQYIIDESTRKIPKNKFLEFTCHFSSPIKCIGSPDLILAGKCQGKDEKFLAKFNRVGKDFITFRYKLDESKSYADIKAIGISSKQGHIIDADSTDDVPLEFLLPDTTKYKLSIDHEPPLEFEDLDIGNYAVGGIYKELTPLKNYNKYMNDLLNPKIRCYDNQSGIHSVKYTVLCPTNNKVYETKVIPGQKLPIKPNDGLLPFYKNKVEFAPQLNMNKNLYNNLEGKIVLLVEAKDTTGRIYSKTYQYLIDRKSPNSIDMGKDFVSMASLQDIIYRVQDTGVGVNKVLYKFNATNQFDIIGASEAELLSCDSEDNKRGYKLAHFTINPNNFSWISYRIIDKLGNIRDGVLVVDTTKPTTPKVEAKCINSGVDYNLNAVRWTTEPLEVYIHSGQNDDLPNKYNGGIKYTYWRIDKGKWNRHEFNPVICNKSELVTTLKITKPKSYHIEVYSEDILGTKSPIGRYTLKIGKIDKPKPKLEPPKKDTTQEEMDKVHYIYLNNNTDYKLTNHSIVNERLNKKLEIPINHTENEISFRGVKLSNGDIAIISTNAVHTVGIITDSNLNIKSYITINQKSTNPVDIVEYYRTLYIGFGGEGYVHISLRDYKDISNELTPPINSFTVAQNHIYFSSTGTTPIYVYNFYKNQLNLLRNHSGYDIFGSTDNTACKSIYYYNNHYIAYPMYSRSSTAYHVIIKSKEK